MRNLLTRYEQLHTSELFCYSLQHYTLYIRINPRCARENIHRKISDKKALRQSNEHLQALQQAKNDPNLPQE